MRDVVITAALELPFTRREPDRLKPQVWMTGFGASSLDFELVVWLAADAVKRPRSVNAAYTWAIDDALRAAGIEIPFPQQDVRVRSLFGLEGEAARELAFGRRGAGSVPDERPSAPSRNDALEDASRARQDTVDAARAPLAPPPER